MMKGNNLMLDLKRENSVIRVDLTHFVQDKQRCIIQQNAAWNCYIHYFVLYNSSQGCGCNINPLAP
jgi:hypothetical protein